MVIELSLLPAWRAFVTPGDVFVLGLAEIVLVVLWVQTLP
ncbi:hypothetical protein Rrhod_3508 [Rhodococcus rhodnii LMG 5362]|uniref:Uncharacterized protein n=1 Tax=Rhodococcus rhodnii LMG 5362 TaxID=1273125 RepID=R7WMD9_9NOCA|nr:hypothetical protein Rrhod_3508 [Rhodococcus rhodnii LMG 5362]